MDEVDSLPSHVLLIYALAWVAEELVPLLRFHEEDRDLLFRELVLQRGRLLLRTLNQMLSEEAVHRLETVQRDLFLCQHVDLLGQVEHPVVGVRLLVLVHVVIPDRVEIEYVVYVLWQSVSHLAHLVFGELAVKVVATEALLLALSDIVVVLHLVPIGTVLLDRPAVEPAEVGARSRVLEEVLARLQLRWQAPELLILIERKSGLAKL